MIPSTEHAAALEDAVAEKIRLRIKERDPSATRIDVQTRGGYAIVAVERPELFERGETQFLDYLGILDFKADDGRVRSYKRDDRDSTFSYQSGNAFVQVSRG